MATHLGRAPAEAWGRTWLSHLCGTNCWCHGLHPMVEGVCLCEVFRDCCREPMDVDWLAG